MDDQDEDLKPKGKDYLRLFKFDFKSDSAISQRRLSRKSENNCGLLPGIEPAKLVGESM